METIGNNSYFAREIVVYVYKIQRTARREVESVTDLQSMLSAMRINSHAESRATTVSL